MIAWISIFIPIVAVAILLFFFRKQTTYLEIILLIAPSALLILLMNFAMVSSNESDTEYLGNYITKVIYYEPWNEKVSCRHPIYCTRTKYVGSGKNRHSTTERYVCGHRHAFDVDFHSEDWTKKDNSGSEHGISKSEFLKLQAQFGTRSYFVELNRDYYTIDGNSYDTDWNGTANTSDVISYSRSYKNKVKASHSIFKFENISEKEKTQWKLYDYPDVSSNMNQAMVIGQKGIDAETQRKLQYINGFYGASKQFRMYILFFKEQSMDVAYKQRSYWEGGNKNEFIVCVGTDSHSKYKWCKCFSWMDKPDLEVRVESWMGENKNDYGAVDLIKFSDWMPKQIESHWKRKDFKDFEYLSVEISGTQLMWILIIVGLYNIGMSVWIVLNEFKNK